MLSCRRVAMLAILASAATAAGIALGAFGTGFATAGYGPGPAEDPVQNRPNPCVGELRKLLRCPDLRMATPDNLYITRGQKLLLHSGNNIESRGEGALEVRGSRIGPRSMAVRQVIRTAAGKRRYFDTGGLLAFQTVPGDGSYWKFHAAARFELWKPASEGQDRRRVRRGPKLNYCLRDLARTAPSRRSPPSPVFPACSQSSGLEKITLGTSVGWSDIYPSGYYQNWINVGRLRGCYVLILRADPQNRLFENDETNNVGKRRVMLTGRTGGAGGC